jgi:hypothetical protein
MELAKARAELEALAGKWPSPDKGLGIRVANDELHSHGSPGHHTAPKNGRPVTPADA